MECNKSRDVSIGIGPFGDPGGERFIYKPRSPIKQIVIRHKDYIDSLIFICEEGKVSHRFGGNGGYNTSKVNIDCPTEYLTGITGTMALLSSGFRVIRSLRFHTNVTTYGPFGLESANDAFTMPVEDGFIVGFHGRFGPYLYAIGYYVRPLQTNSLTFTNPSKNTLKTVVPRDSMLFGRLCHTCGRQEFDDGVFAGIKQIILHIDNIANVLHAFRIQYVSPINEGRYVWSHIHGAHSISLQKININHPEEYLIGFSGYHGPPIKPANGMDVIRSIAFMTNKDVYGPFGREGGSFFTSPPDNGKIVGFYGRSGAYLYSLGVHIT